MKIVPFVLLLCVPVSSEAVCSMTINNFAFGLYTPTNAAPLDATGNVAVSCDGIAGQVISYAVSMNAGKSGAFVSRKMIYTTYSLNYNLYLDASRTTVWGDGNVGTGVLSDSYTSIAGTNVRSYPIYGRIPSGQALPPGAYNDSLVVTLGY